MYCSNAIESCPGDFQWSAFGADPPDTACSTSLAWKRGKKPKTPVLCDVNKNNKPSDIPCPMCNPKGFEKYLEVPEKYVWVWPDRTPLTKNTEIHFHDGDILTWSATHPDLGEQPVIMIRKR